MDPFSTAVIAALQKLSEPMVKDAYEGLKRLIVQRMGAGNRLSAAVDAAEIQPSPGRLAVLQEEAAALQAAADEGLRPAIEALLDTVRSAQGGQQVINQLVSGSHNVFTGTGNIYMNPPPSAS